MLRIEASAEGIGCSEFSADHDIMARLVPKVVVELDGMLFPSVGYLEGFAVDKHEWTLFKKIKWKR